MKHFICFFLLLLLAPLLLAQPLPVEDDTSVFGGSDGAGGDGFAPLILEGLPGLNYSVTLADEAITLKNTSEHPNILVIIIKTENWLMTSRSFRLESDQKIEFEPQETTSPVEAIRVLSMLPFEVGFKEDAPLIGSSPEAILQPQSPAESFGLGFIEDASGQVIPVGVMDDGSVHYPLFGKRIGVIENETVLIDGTQQRFELLE